MRSALVGVLLLAATAVAYEAIPPKSFAKPAAGGKFVLVIRHPVRDGKPDEVREKYSNSGLFACDESVRPVWTCMWSADRPEDVVVSADGTIAVRVPSVDIGERRWALNKGKGQPGWQKPLPAGWEDRPAVYVYENGQPRRTLAVKDVFDCSRFTFRDQYLGPVVEIDSLDDDTGLVVVSTAHEDGTRQTATIDFRTGRVVSGDVVDARTRERGWVIASAAGIGVLVLGLAVWLIRRRKR